MFSRVQKTLKKEIVKEKTGKGGHVYHRIGDLVGPFNFFFLGKAEKKGAKMGVHRGAHGRK